MKKVGISRLHTTTTQSTSYTTLSSNLTSARSAQLQTQLTLFKEILLSSSDKLMQSPTHRAKFLSLCAKIGINPLGLYDRRLDFNEFYNLLCLNLIEFWNETRGLNGGLLSLDSFEKKYCANDGIELTEEDWNVVLKSLQVLSPGVVLMELGGNKFISFDDQGLVSSGDENQILGQIMTKGCASEAELLEEFFKDELGEFRMKEVLGRLVMKGYVWIDEFEGVTTYWDPSMLGL